MMNIGSENTFMVLQKITNVECWEIKLTLDTIRNQIRMQSLISGKHFCLFSRQSLYTLYLYVVHVYVDTCGRQT